jgi:hypothetical protein
MINIGPPRQLKSPIRIEKILVYSGKQVIKGESLLLVSGIDGDVATIAAQMGGTVFFPSTVYEGAQIAHDEIIISMKVADENADEADQARPPQPDVKPQKPTPKRTLDPAVAGAHVSSTPLHVAAAVVRERDKFDSGMYRSLWVADQKDVIWGGVMPSLSAIAVFAFVFFPINFLFRVAFPGLYVGPMTLISLVCLFLAAFVTVALVRRWKRRPSPAGLTFPMVAAALVAGFLGLIPDDVIDGVIGVRPYELVRKTSSDTSSSTYAVMEPSKQVPTSIKSSTSQATVQGSSKTIGSEVPALHAWVEGYQDEPQYIKYMEGTVAIGAEVVKRDGPFDKVYHLDSGEHGMSKAIISMCDTRNDNKWAEVVSIENGQYTTLRHYSDRCGRPCAGCADADVILLDIFGTDSGGRPRINREFVNASGITRRIAHKGIQSEYCSFDWRRCD